MQKAQKLKPEALYHKSVEREKKRKKKVKIEQSAYCRTREIESPSGQADKRLHGVKQ